MSEENIMVLIIGISALLSQWLSLGKEWFSYKDNQPMEYLCLTLAGLMAFATGGAFFAWIFQTF